MSSSQAAAWQGALLGLGGNVGTQAEIVARMRAVVDAVRGHRAMRYVGGSSVYSSVAWGPVVQPDYLNAVIAVDTTLEPCDLLAWAKTTENEAGRVKRIRWGPREIDIDILLNGRRVVALPDLVIPHPHMLNRPFAWFPLLEVAPDACLPDGRRVVDVVGGGPAGDYGLIWVACLDGDGDAGNVVDRRQ